MKNVGELKQFYFKFLQISGTSLLLVLTVPFTWSLASPTCFQCQTNDVSEDSFTES